MKSITKIQAFQLADFIETRCLPTELTSIQNYSKIHRVRLLLEDIVPEFVDRKRTLKDRFEDLSKPFQAKLQELALVDNQKAIEYQRASTAEVRALCKPLSDENQRYMDEYGEDEVQIEFDPDDLKQVRAFFESITTIENICQDCKKATKREVTRGSTYWHSPNEYLAIAKFLGCLDTP